MTTFDRFYIEKTNEFDKWFRKLKDVKAKAILLFRLQRIEHGNLGDITSVGEGLEELRIHYGPGYRIYFKRHHAGIMLLLIGGDKGSQEKDNKKAKKLWDKYKIA
ncbi:MAG: hypothetical protein RLZZ241_2109 [Bacteroidota bacterium]